MASRESHISSWRLMLGFCVCLFIGCHGSSPNDAMMRAMPGYPPAPAYIMQDQNQNISAACREKLQNLTMESDSLTNLMVLDSFGKPTPGMLVGNTAWLGHFDECMNITDFRYCLVDMGVNVTLNTNSSLTLPLSWGVCIPEICSEIDVENGLDMLLELLNISWISLDSVSASAVHCTDKPDTDFDAAFIGTCVAMGLLFVLSVAGTILDKHMKHKQTQADHQQASHMTPHGFDTGQRSSQVSRSPSYLYAKVDKKRKRNEDGVTGQSGEVNEGHQSDTEEGNLYSTVDDVAGLRERDAGRGQRSSEEEEHVYTDVADYRAMGQASGAASSGQAGKREISAEPISPATETTALLIGSKHQQHDVPAAAEQEIPKPGFFCNFLLCFALSRNLPKILRAKQAPGGIPCLNGIRVISIAWVILGHSISMVMGAGVNENLLNAASIIKTFAFQVILSTPLAVDTFFFLSGLLITYLSLRRLKANDGKLGWGWLYIHRYIRLTPALAMLILFFMFILPNMSQGPVWHRWDIQVEQCKKWWWTDLLYVNNFVPSSMLDTCIPWAWYLANDMQFFIISPPLIAALYRFPGVGLASVSLLCLGSFAVTGALVGLNDFQAGIRAFGFGWESDTLVSPQETSSDNYGDMVYSKPYCRIPPYLVGMALGYFMYDIGHKKPFFPPVFIAAGWAIASALGMAVVYGLYGINGGYTEPSQVVNIMYNTFAPFTWAVAVSWVVFACHYGFGGVVNDILSWEFWIPLSRLTYSTYLIHPLVQYLYGYSTTVPLHLSVINMSIIFTATLLLAHCAALIMCALVEFPFGNLEKMLIGATRKSD